MVWDSVVRSSEVRWRTQCAHHTSRLAYAINLDNNVHLLVCNIVFSITWCRSTFTSFTGVNFESSSQCRAATAAEHTYTVLTHTRELASNNYRTRHNFIAHHKR